MKAAKVIAMRTSLNPLRRELLAFVAGLVVAPLASIAVTAVDAWLLIAAHNAFGRPLDPPDEGLVRLFVAEPRMAFMVAYMIAWLVVFPPILLLRARRWLTLWTAVAPALVLPLSGASTMALLFWWMAGAAADEMLALFAFLAYLIVPGSVATAVAFWMIYRSLGRPDRTAAPDPARSGFT